jgi:hypothetical protein
MRDVIKGKKWLLLSRWKNLAKNQRGVLNRWQRLPSFQKLAEVPVPKV